MLAAAFLGGCAAGSAASGAAPRGEFTRLCRPAGNPGQARTADLALPPAAARSAADQLLARGYSPTAVRIAEAIGALPALQRYAALAAGDARGPAAELRLLRQRQEITDRILLAMLDVSGMLAEIDCEGERGDQLRVHLQNAEDRRTRRLSLASILVGALTASLSGGLSLANAAGGDVVGIVGGVTEASVAGSLLFGSAEGDLYTERNLLREVWEAPAQSSLFPPAVWRFLTGRRGDGADRPSIAELLAAEWRADERLGHGQPPGQDRTGLLFGTGGRYTIEDLELRDAMLDLLEASIALMSRELRVLLEELMQRPAAEPPRPAALAGMRRPSG
jgi:hypothetical protein